MESKFNFSMVVITVFSIVFWGFKPKQKMNIDGVWSVVEVQTVKEDGVVMSTFPKESVVLFSKNYYSFCWTSQQSRKESWQMADSVKLSRFNQSIINTGSFSLKDSILTTKAIFAMNPMFTGGLAKFKCSFKGDTLFLSGISVKSASNVSHPIYAQGSYFINKLVRK